MMLSTLFVSALLAGPQAGSVHPFIQGESLPALLVGALQPESRRPLPGTLYPGIGSWARNQPRTEAGCCALETPPALGGVYTTDAVGSLGRVGNPFEVPVGMSGEWQMAGSDPALDLLSLRVPTIPNRNVALMVSASSLAGRVSIHAASAADKSSTQEEQGKPDYVLRTGAVFLTALTVAEIEVTRAVIERGGTEQNPIYKPFEDKPGVLGLVNGAITGGLGLVALELNRRGKKTEARIFVWTMVAVKAVVFTHNVRELRKTGRNR